MASTRNTSTVLAGPAGQNRTAIHLATHIIVKVDGNKVGAVKSLSVTEARPIKMISEVGTDGNIDGAPTASTKITGRCSRVRFDKMRISEAFNRGFVHVGSQRIPFDIEIQDIFAENDEARSVITTLQGVWISEISYEYSSEDFHIVDNMSFEAKRVFSLLNSGNVAQATANGRANPIVLNQFEQEADIGKYTGALDAAGLLQSYITG